MELDSNSLFRVFNALDTEQQGYITVEKFMSALEQFYNSTRNDSRSPERSRKMSLDVANIVAAVDPQNDGIIYFDDFRSTFQEFFSCKDSKDLMNKSMTLKVGGRSVSIIPDDYAIQNLIEGETDMKTEDSGYNDYNGFDHTTVSPQHNSEINSRLEIRKGWQGTAPSNVDPPHSAYDNTGSPFSESRSDLFLDDVDSNFELMRTQLLSKLSHRFNYNADYTVSLYKTILDQMKRMEERFETMSNNQTASQESVSKRLREEVTRLNSVIAVLEERLKETEARCKRDLTSEKNHFDSLMNRNKHSYESEIEILRGRLHAMEAEMLTYCVSLTKAKAEAETLRKDYSEANSSLIDAQERMQAMQDELDATTAKDSGALKKAIADRDQAVTALKAVSNSPNATNNTADLSLSAVSRIEEMQQIIRRLKDDNKDLSLKIQDLQEELLARSVADGKLLLNRTDNTFGDELDTLTKEEVVDLLTLEKHANNQLRTYLNNLLEKVMMHHPEMLESK